MSPFDPTNLEPPVSLNRVIVADLPGLEHDPGLRGRTGYELLSARALATLIRTRADALKLDPALNDDALNRAFGARVATGVRIPAAAHAVARQAGRRLGYLLVALRRGDAPSRAARPEWDESYWAHWAGIRRIWLGGGIVSGWLGQPMCHHAMQVFAEAGFDDYTIRCSPYGSALPLIGMARKAPPGCQSALVFDAGQTAIQRALALFGDDELRQVTLFPALPTEPSDVSADPENHVERAWWLLDRFVTVIDQTRDLALGVLRQSGHDAPPNLPVLASLAAYMRDGHPLAAQRGTYVQWIHITRNARDLVAERLADRWGVHVPVTLAHDGTAAAAAHAGDDPRTTAVITMGTVLGIGFPPEAESVCPLAAAFEIMAST